MNLQAQQKSSSKRTGKRVACFNEQEIAVSSKEPQQQLKEGQYYGPGGNIPVSQTMEISHAAGLTGAPNNVALMNSVYSQDRGESMMMSQTVTAVKWQNSLMGNRVPERGDSHWQSPPSVWNHNMVFGGNPKGPHSNTSAPGFYGHSEALKRNQEKGVFVSQLDLYGDAVQQMMSQKAQLEQQALVRQQSQINTFHQMQKQQQQQSQSLPLQPFQLAFGHQGQKQGLPELLHVFQEAPTSSSQSFTAQQKQQALPQLQLFENFYPQQQQQQQAATQAFSLQQTASSIAQPHVAAAARQHRVMAHQFQQTERNQELFKALTEQNQQTVLPQTQIPFPRRSRRLSKEGVLLTPAGEMLASKQTEEQSSNLFLHHWQTHQQEIPLHQTPESVGHSKGNYLQPKRIDLGQKDVLVNSELCQMETDRQATTQNGTDEEKQAAAAEEKSQRTDFQGVRGGVIQSTRRRRRGSQEANLLTLAQKAVELASLQNMTELDTSEEKKSMMVAASGPTAAKSVVEFASSSPALKRAREDNNLVPLIIPVSVPVRKIDLQSLGKEKSEDGKLQKGQTNERTPCERKPSVIVTRRRSNRNTNMESSNQ
ncbi:EMSA1 protein, partial [Semnornis frantzii]|nr:EMSA1 protein [Semnornis frantzii]